MNNQLLSQIEVLYNSIEERENEYFILVNSDCNFNTLQSKETNIEELKTRLHQLEELFLKQSLASFRKY